jgi:ATP-dependent helicase HrpB
VDFRVDACRTIGVHAHAARQVGPLLDQFLRIAEQEGLDVRPRDASKDALRKCILIGFSDRVARRLDEATLRCELVHGRRGTLARESAARGATLLVAAEVREVEGKKLDTILSLATAIEPAWLAELFAEDVSARTHTYYDAGTKRVYAEEQRLFRDLVLERRPVDPSADEAARILAEEVAAGRLKLNGWDVHVEQWILRRNLLARACPELGLGAMGEAERRRIVERICRGGFSHREIKDRPVMSVVRGELSPEQQALVEKHAPERLALSNGRTPKLTYAADGPPRLSAKIQDLFGVRQVPKVAMGRVAPVVEILAPNMRPVQVTQDLAAFWREHYPALRKDLQRRYPKHDWREA